MGGYYKMLITAYILGGWAWTNAHVRFLEKKKNTKKNCSQDHSHLGIVNIGGKNYKGGFYSTLK